MKILIVGSGAREDALAWRLTRDGNVADLATVPGNLGTLRWGKNLDGTPEAAADYFKPDLVVVGPETPLADGLADRLRAKGFAVFGPGAAGARIESSKIFSKELMALKGIPTARSEIVRSLDEGLRALDSWPGGPVVVKVDGLAQGKGVMIASDPEEARSALDDAFVQKKFGDAGSQVLLEQFLTGREATVLAITDGTRMHILPTSEDHKQVHDGDKGPNTGGMGAISPTPVITPRVLDRVRDRILLPLLEALREKVPGGYRGLLYAGIMVEREEPSVVEFNCRFGDPEAQSVLPRITGNLADALLSAARGELDASGLGESPEFTTCVVVASGGYPGAFEKGKIIDGALMRRWETTGAIAFLSGVAKENHVVTTGGRVASIVGFGRTFEESRDKAYRAVQMITFEGMHFRGDIGMRGLA